MKEEVAPRHTIVFNEFLFNVFFLFIITGPDKRLALDRFILSMFILALCIPKCFFHAIFQ
jgi:hypothetical protein